MIVSCFPFVLYSSFSFSEFILLFNHVQREQLYSFGNKSIEEPNTNKRKKEWLLILCFKCPLSSPQIRKAFIPFLFLQTKWLQSLERQLCCPKGSLESE